MCVEASFKKCPPTLYHFNCYEGCVLMITEKTCFNSIFTVRGCVLKSFEISPLSKFDVMGCVFKPVEKCPRLDSIFSMCVLMSIKNIPD